jgi:hypothetical protein
VSLMVVVWPFFPDFIFIFGAPSSSAPVAGSSSHGGRRCPAHGLHAPESLLLFGARDGHAPLLLAVHGTG